MYGTHEVEQQICIANFMVLFDIAQISLSIKADIYLWLFDHFYICFDFNS